MSSDSDLVRVARKVIVTYEERVPSCELGVNGTVLDSHDDIVFIHAPNGAYPTGCTGYYEADICLLRRIHELSTDGPGNWEKVVELVGLSSLAG